MQTEEAEVILEDAELVACLEATLLEAKQLRDACLEADIPVLLDRGKCCGGVGKASCGCAPKLNILARAEDLPRVTQLVHQRWREMALREGTVSSDHPAVAPADGPEAPCPACGTAAPLQGGACIDCGLQLE